MRKFGSKEWETQSAKQLKKLKTKKKCRNKRKGNSKRILKVKNGDLKLPNNKDNVQEMR